MKESLFIFMVLLFSLGSCKNPKPNQTEHKKDSTAVSGTIYKGFYVDDASKYSKAFLDSIKASTYADSTRLVNNHIIVGKDTITFPEDLKPGHSYDFKGEKDSIKYVLTVKRANMTDIVYNYTIKKADSTLYQDKGTVTLNPMFFLSTENPDDDKTGEGYGAMEYFHDSKDCSIYIGIGLGLDDNKKLRAYAKANCTTKKLPPISEELTLRADKF